MVKNKYTLKKGNRILPVSISVGVIILLVASTTQVSSMISLKGNSIAVPNKVFAKYSNSQAQSIANDCSIAELGSANCANNGPQIQAAGTASSPIVSIL